jgi:hypothetical protein
MFDLYDHMFTARDRKDLLDLLDLESTPLTVPIVYSWDREEMTFLYGSAAYRACGGDSDEECDVHAPDRSRALYWRGESTEH